jgi:hypothetical protein
MKANELRIGNLVMYFKDTPNKVIGLANGKLYVRYDDDKYFMTELEDASPIPLTEEWLIKFGFGDARITDRLYTRKKTDGFYGFYINKETMSYCTFDYEGTIDDIIKIEYVHQLQNLYFAVTNEELTMK